jgi:hypothetical protein
MLAAGINRADRIKENPKRRIIGHSPSALS